VSTLPGPNERRLFKDWARNNVPGKKGFQPKATGDRMVDNNAGRVHPEMPPTTAELTAHAAAGAAPRVTIDDSDKITIRRAALTNDERQAANLPSSDSPYHAMIHPDGKTTIGYAREQWDYEMAGRYRTGVQVRTGYKTFGLDGKELGYGSNASGAKWSMSKDWNKSVDTGFKSVAIPGAPKKATITAGRYSRRSGQVLGDATSRGRSLSGGGYRIVALPTGRGTKIVLVPKTDLKGT